MTDPMNAPTTALAAAPAPASSAMSGMLSSMSRAELFMAGGAALILLTDLVFVIFGDYSFSNIVWGSAALALILILTNGRMGMDWSRSTYQKLLFLVGALAVFAAIRDLLYDVLFIPGRSLSVTYYLGAVGFYIGVALMAFGAWQLWKGRGA